MQLFAKRLSGFVYLFLALMFVTARAEDSKWNTVELGHSGSAATSASITVLSRSSDHMEIFWIGADGSVQDMYFYEGQGWKYLQLAPPGSASLTGGITAVSRRPGHMEVWWISPNGSVQDAYWYEGSEWKRSELAAAGSASVESGMMALSREERAMEVWWVAPNGSVQGAYWFEGSVWKYYELSPAGGAPKGAKISGVSRNSGHLEVQWVAPNGAVQNMFWYEGQKWQYRQLAPPGSGIPSGGIAAASHRPNQMEVWWIAPDGSVQDAYWYEGSDWKRFELAPGEKKGLKKFPKKKTTKSASTTGSITALSRKPGHLEVWWVAADGSIQDAYFYEGSTWQRFELAPARSASTTGGICAVTRATPNMEVWWITPQGAVQDAYFYMPVDKPIHYHTGYITFPDPTPIGGYADVDISKDGTYTFTGHLHNSGNFLMAPYSVSIAVGIKTTSGKLFTFTHSTAFGPPGSRDHDWQETGKKAELAQAWTELQQGWKGDYGKDASLSIDAAIEQLKKIAGAVETVIGIVNAIG